MYLEIVIKILYKCLYTLCECVCIFSYYKCKDLYYDDFLILLYYYNFITLYFYINFRLKA